MASITLRHVTKVLGDRRRTVSAVSDLNLTVPDRELAVLVGPSGCGKTTTLRLIAGLDEPTSGEILLGDRVANRIPPKDRDVAMVFQNHALYPHLSVFDNLAFGLRMRRVARGDIRSRVHAMAAALQLTPLLGQRPGRLSGGECQRVALGRALVRNPSVFLLDEPLSSMDAGLRVSMRAEFKGLQRRMRTTTLYVTHDQEEAMTLGDRLILLRDGVIQQIGPPCDVYRCPANRFVAAFLGVPAMNFLTGELKRGEADCVLEGDTGSCLARFAEAPRPAVVGIGRVVMGFRPEHVRLSGRGDTREPAPGSVVRLGIGRPLATEFVGDRVNVRVILESGPIVSARLSASVRIDAAAPVALNVPVAEIHWFRDDPHGERLPESS